MVGLQRIGFKQKFWTKSFRSSSIAQEQLPVVYTSLMSWNLAIGLSGLILQFRHARKVCQYRHMVPHYYVNGWFDYLSLTRDRLESRHRFLSGNTKSGDAWRRQIDRE